MKSIISITVPSKTFLIGEYLALEQHCGIVLNTQPCFQLNVSFNSPLEKKFLFNKYSPAALFSQDNEPLFKNLSYDFIDPYLELGGFGASSAQFIALAALKHVLETDTKTLSEQHIKHIHQTYLTIIEKNNSRASGVDVIGQCLGQVALIDCHKYIYQAHPWPFQQLSFLLFKTPFKIKTHEHVINIKHIPVDELKKIFEDTQQSFVQRDQQKFLSSIQHYAAVLKQHDLTLKEISDVCTQLSQPFPNAIAKGCGALGADVLLVLIDKEHKNEIKTWCAQHDMKFIADEDNLTDFQIA